MNVHGSRRDVAARPLKCYLVVASSWGISGEHGFGRSQVRTCRPGSRAQGHKHIIFLPIKSYGSRSGCAPIT